MRLRSKIGTMAPFGAARVKKLKEGREISARLSTAAKMRGSHRRNAKVGERKYHTLLFEFISSCFYLHRPKYICISPGHVDRVLV